MDVDIQASLEAVIDPTSALASTPLSPALTIPPIQETTPPIPKTPITPIPVPVSISANELSPSQPTHKDATESKSKSKTPKTTKKRSGVIPNSAADFRRREANRLAAERSRSRTTEKYDTLYYNQKVLSEENKRLKQQIEDLENGSSIDQHDSEILVPESQPLNVNHTTGTTDENHHPQQHQSSPSTSNHIEESILDTQQPIEDDEENHNSQQAQEAHSNTILAALTDITGVDFSQNNDETNWIQGMESLLSKDSQLDTSSAGRLAELAVVATTGQDEPQVAQSHSQKEGHDQNHNHSTLLGGNEQDSEDEEHNTRSDRPLIPSPANNPIIALAAAINTEIERIIMEDLAETKAAIATIEKQIESMKDGQPISTDDINEQDGIESILPESIFIEDLEKLSNLSTEMQEEITTIKSTLPQLHKDLVHLRDEKTDEEKKMVDLVKQVRDLDIPDENKKISFISSLKSLGGFIENLLNEGPGRDLSYASGSYSTPAIARRRRGRPPKGDVSRAIYQSFLLQPSTPSKPESISDGVSKSRTSLNAKSNPKPKSESRPRLTRKSRKSKLSKRIDFIDGEEEEQEEKQEDVERNLREIQASAQAQEEEGIQSQQKDQSSAQSQEAMNVINDQVVQQINENNSQEEGEIELDTIDQEATAEAVNRAEAFILSQLASQSNSNSGSRSNDQDLNQNDQHEHDRDNTLNLNQSTSFADFLPAQEELERQANQQNQNSSIDPQLSQIQSQQSQPTQQNHTGIQENINQNVVPPIRQNSESALARLKKGPPGSCDICMRTETTVWRKLTLGEEDLKVCNACGLYHKKFGVIRPPELWDDGNSIRRRRTTSRTPLKLTGGEDDILTDGERPTKRAKKGGSSLKKTVGINAGNNDVNTNDNNDDIGTDGQLSMQEEEEGRRMALNVALMEGITAISASTEQIQDQDQNQDQGDTNSMPIQEEVSINELPIFDEANQPDEQNINLVEVNGEDSQGQTQDQTSQTQGGLVMHDDEHDLHQHQNDDISSVFGM